MSIRAHWLYAYSFGFLVCSYRKTWLHDAVGAGLYVIASIILAELAKRVAAQRPKPTPPTLPPGAAT